MTRAILSFGLVVLAGAAGWAAEPAWPQPPEAAERAVAAALEANLALQANRADLDRAAARLAAARSLYFPRLDLVARYTRADGGRTIDIPTGDLLNPVYRALNGLTGTSAFPQIENSSIALLRSREQETKLRLLQPLYRPEIGAGRRAARAQLAASEATVAAFRRELRYQVQEAWFTLSRAEAGVRILRSALGLVEESLRVNRALRDVDRVTDDVVLRAEAEVAAVRQELAAAERDRALARAYFNQLLNRPLDESVEAAEPAALDEYRRRLEAIDPAALALSPANREELRALDEAIVAARAAVSAAQAGQRPSVSLAIEAGTQGEDYGLGRDYDYAIGSVVAEWNLFDRGERRAEVAAARADVLRAELNRRDIESRLALELRQASERFTVARFALEAAGQRRRAALAGYRVVQAREREGSAPQLTVLDARNTLTAAEFAVEIGSFELFTAAARLERSAALHPTP